MKQLILTSVIILLASCSKQIDDNSKIPVEFCVSNVKTTLVGSSIVWEKGESISILDGSDNNEFRNSLYGTEAVFKGLARSSDIYYAVYPYDEDNLLNGSVIKTAIPSVQIARKDGFGSKANPSVGRTGGNYLEMKNICGYIKFEVNRSDFYTSVILSAPGGEKIAGPIDVGFDENSNLVSVLCENSVSRITLKAENGTIEQGIYYIALAPTEFSKGLVLTFIDGDGNEYEKPLDYVTRVERSRPLYIKGDGKMERKLVLDIDFSQTAFVPSLPSASSTEVSYHTFEAYGMKHTIGICCAYKAQSHLLFKGLNGSTSGFIEFPAVPGMILKKVNIFIMAHTTNHGIHANIEDAGKNEFASSFVWNEASVAVEHEYVLGKSGNYPIEGVKYRLLSHANRNCHIRRILLTYFE